MRQRFVEVLIDNEWQIRTYAAVKEGMVFKVFEPTGELLETPDGSGELYALSDAKKEGDNYVIDFMYNNY